MTAVTVATTRRRRRRKRSTATATAAANVISLMMLMILVAMVCPSSSLSSSSGLGLSVSVSLLSVGVEALDIGNVLKNIGRDRDRDGNKGNNGEGGEVEDDAQVEHAIVTTTEEKGGVQIVKSLIRDSISNSIHNSKKEQEELEKQRRQEMIDASTGTVTLTGNSFNSNGSRNNIHGINSNQHQHQQQQQHVSCNEIMAKAVVVASEEKDEAYTQRDDALHKLHQANVQITSLSTQIEIALEESKNATIEAEATKLMTQRLMEDYKKQKETEVADLLVQHDVNMQKLYQQLKDTRESYDKQLRDQKKDSEEMIQSIRETAKKDVHEMYISTEEEKAKLEAETIRIQNGMEVQKAQMDRMYDDMRKKLIHDKVLEIEGIHDNYEKILQSNDDTISQLQYNMTQQSKTYNETLSNMTIAHDKRIHDMQTQHHDQQVQTMNEAYEIERNVQRDMEQLKKDVNVIIEDTNKKAQLEYERVTKSAQEEVDRIVEDVDRQLLDKEKVIAELHLSLSKSSEEYKASINELKEELEKYKDGQSLLERKISQTTQELNYWKNVGSHPTHVNTTLIYMDAVQYINDMKYRTKRSVRQYSDTTMNKVHIMSEPHVAKCYELYNVHMKQYVDQYIGPNYETYIAPAVQQIVTQVRTTYEDEIVPHYNDCVSGVQTMIVKSTSHCAKSILMAVEVEVESKSKSNSNSSFVFNFLVRLRDEEEYTTQFVQVSLKMIAVVLVFLFRYTILRLIWKVVKFVVWTPFTIMWFFCPLRLVIGGKGKGSSSGSGSGSGTKGNGSRTKAKGSSSNSTTSSRKSNGSSNGSSNGGSNGTTYKNGTSGSVVKS